MSKNYKDYWYTSSDGLKLYAREYGDENADSIICIPGLTRSSADFALLCEELSSHYHLLAVDLRGRGRSDYDSNPDNYQPATYAADVLALMDAKQLDRVKLIGTSLGGLTSMILCATSGARIRGAVINDIGPEANPEGIARIKAYVCASPPPVTTWQEAVQRTRDTQQREYPLFNDEDWQTFTRNLYVENSDGQPVLNYDPNIAVPLQADSDGIPPDLWPLFEAAAATPMLLLRGELSDLLSRDCVARMQAIKPDLHVLEVANTGHAPLLTEPTARAAITAFLDSHNR